MLPQVDSNDVADWGWLKTYFDETDCCQIEGCGLSPTHIAADGDNRTLLGCKTVYPCACGAEGAIVTGWFVDSPDKAVWRCAPCDRAARGVRLF